MNRAFRWGAQLLIFAALVFFVGTFLRTWMLREQLKTALRRGDRAAVVSALDNGADPRTVEGRSTVLRWAAFWRWNDVIRKQLEIGVDPNLPCPYGQTPLIIAAMSPGDDPSGVDLLLAYGADPFHKDQSGKTALDYAKASPFKAVMIALNRQHPSMRRAAPSP